MFLKDIPKFNLEYNISIPKKFFSIFTLLGKLRPTLQIKFKNRILAASILSAAIKDKIGKELVLDRNNFIVLGIPRGGVVVADSVATILGIKYFDIVIPRKLTDIDNKEQAIGAIMEDGTTYIDDMLISDLQLDSSYLETEKHNQIEEIKRRKFLYCNDDLGLDHNVIEGRTVILIDDGIATGATLLVSTKWIKKNYDPKKLIIATPVASKASLNLLIKECDLIVTVTCPKECFYSVEQYYQSFNQVEDSEVIEIMNRRKMNNHKT